VVTVGAAAAHSIGFKRGSILDLRATYVDEHLYNIQCSEICTLINENLHTEA
jgi:hypothetical protein